MDSNEDVYSEFSLLTDVELTYEAILLNGEKSRFTHDLQTMLYRAKEGILPYISFKEHVVNSKPVITIKRNKIKKPA